MDNVSHGFIKTPKEFYINEEFAALSGDAKALFAMILDRTELSYKNRERFTDEGGEVFIYFTIDEICRKIGCGNKKAIELLHQLVNKDLIIKKRKGCGMPTRIYLSDKSRGFIEPYVGETAVKCYNDTFESVKTTRQKVSESHTINTYNNNTDISNTDSSFFYEETVEEIKEQIEYDLINGDPEIVEEIIMIIADVITAPANTIKIGGMPYRKEAVEKRFRLLCAEHIEEIINTLKKTETPIRNMRNYIMVLLFNAPTVYAAADAAEIAYLKHTHNRNNEN